MIPGWNTPNGFLGKCCPEHFFCTDIAASYSMFVFSTFFFFAGVSIYSRRRGKSLFSRSRLGSHVCSSRLVKSGIKKINLLV